MKKQIKLLSCLQNTILVYGGKMIINRTLQPTFLLGKVYVPGTFFLAYQWMQPKEAIYIQGLDNLNTNLLYFQHHSTNKEWTGWMIRYEDMYWKRLDFDNETRNTIHFDDYYCYSPSIPKCTKYPDLLKDYKKAIAKRLIQ